MTVFQTELYAVASCAIENSKGSSNQRPIDVIPGSQATIKSVMNPITKSNLFKCCKETLNSSNLDAEHKDVKGNVTN